MNKLPLYRQISLLTQQEMTEVFPFYFNQLFLKNTVHSKKWAFLLELKACVRYFLPSFYFQRNDSPSKTMKNVFYFI